MQCGGNVPNLFKLFELLEDAVNYPNLYESSNSGPNLGSKKKVCRIASHKYLTLQVLHTWLISLPGNVRVSQQTVKNFWRTSLSTPHRLSEYQRDEKVLYSCSTFIQPSKATTTACDAFCICYCDRQHYLSTSWRRRWSSDLLHPHWSWSKMWLKKEITLVTKYSAHPSLLLLGTVPSPILTLGASKLSWLGSPIVILFTALEHVQTPVSISLQILLILMGN